MNGGSGEKKRYYVKMRLALRTGQFPAGSEDVVSFRGGGEADGVVEVEDCAFGEVQRLL